MWVKHGQRFRRLRVVCVTCQVAAVGLALGAADHVNDAPASRPAASTTGPSVEDRMRQSLVKTGNVDALAAALSGAADDAQTLDEKASVALERGDLSAAIDDLTRRVTIAPDAKGWTQLAEVQSMSGRSRSAADSLTHAIDLQRNPTQRADLQLRLATLQLDTGSGDGAGLLRAVAGTGADAAVRAGVIAYLFGDYPTSLECLKRAEPNDVALQLLAGNAALRANDFAAAKQAFGRALEHASQKADRTYAQERLITTARRAGTLSQLADAWLAAPDISVDRLFTLATALRELNRAEDLLSLWRREADRPAAVPVVLSKRFLDEVVGAADAAGMADQAEAICADMLARTGGDAHWLAATLRLQLGRGKTAAADALLRAQIEAAKDASDRLLALAKMAKSLGRDDAAVSAAGAMTRFGGQPALDADLLHAAVVDRQGRRSQAKEILQSAGAAAQSQGPQATDDVASAMEAVGDEPAAIALLQQCPAARSDGAMLEHLAMLLLSQQRFADAVVVLEQVVHSNATAAVRAQAGQRLLTAATAANTVAELIARTRAALNAGTGTADDLTILVDAQLQTNHADDAAAVLRTSPLLSPQEKLQRLSVLFLRQKNYAGAYDTLSELVKAAPNDSVDTLQQLAMVAMQAGRPDAAVAAIHQIETRIGPGPVSLELLGGLYLRIGKPAEAAAIYRRALALSDDNSDLWLLWAQAMAKSGRRDAAVSRLQVLSSVAPTDELCGVAADGLLNLSAGPESVRSTRRDVILKLSTTPTAALLFPVLGDLCDEMQDAPLSLRTLDASVPLIGSGRAERVRELLDLAGDTSHTDLAMECGQTLLTLGDNFPPGSFLKLGEELLAADRLPDAQRAFDRAAEASSQDSIALKAADLLSEYGYYRESLQRMASNFRGHESDPAWIEKIAGLQAILGQTQSAFDTYCGAFAVIGQKLSQQVNESAAALLSQSEPVPALDNFATGAMVNAQTPEHQDVLLKRLRDELDLVRAAAVKGPNPPAGVITVLRVLQRIALNLHRPDVVEAADATLLAQWPRSAEIFRAVMSDLLQHGLFTHAANFATAHQLPQADVLRTRIALLDRGPSTGPATMSPKTAALTLPGLIAEGQLQRARDIITAMPQQLPPTPAALPYSPDTVRIASPVSVLITAAAAVDDQVDAARWALQWLSSTPDSARPVRGGALPITVNRVIGSTWRLLDKAGRARLIEAAVARSQANGAPLTAANFAVLALQMNTEQPDEAVDPVKLGLLALRPPTAATAARLLLLMPAKDRPAFLQQAIARVPATEQLEMLTRIAATTSVPFDAETVSAICRAADGLTGAQSPATSGWYANTAQRAVLPALARAVVRVAPRFVDPQQAWVQRATAAVGFANGGDPADADALARQCVEFILQSQHPETDAEASNSASLAQRFGQPRLDPPAMLKLVATAWSDGARAQALPTLLQQVDDDLENLPAVEQAFRLQLKAALLDAAGRRVDALAALRVAFDRAPTVLSVQRSYLQQLQDDGREAEILDAVGPHVPAGTEEPSLRNPITAAYRGLLRVRELKRFNFDSAGNAMPGEVLAPPEAGDPSRLVEPLRIELQRQYVSGWIAPPLLTAPVGGLTPKPDLNLVLPKMTPDDLKSQPDLFDQLMRATRTLSVARSSHVPALASLLGSAGEDPVIRAKLIHALQAAVAANAVTTTDRTLISEIALRCDDDLPQELIHELWVTAVAGGSGADWRTLAAVLQKQHDPAANAVARWAQSDADATDLAGNRQGPPVMPTPVDTVVVQSYVVGAIDSLAVQHPDQAEAQLCRLLTVGQVAPEQEQCVALWAKLAARRGDIDAFGERLDALLEMKLWRDVSGRAVFNTAADIDLRDVLPEGQPPAMNRRYVEAAQAMLRGLARRWPGDRNLQAWFAQLGSWAYGNQFPDLAKSLLDDDVQLMQARGPSQSSLYVADLASELGMNELSNRIELRLLDARCLPAGRMMPLFAKLNTAGEAPRAKRLAREAAAYCKEPAVVEFATAPSPGGSSPGSP